MELELLDLSDADRAFREELRSWLDTNIDAADDPEVWHERLVEGRWVVPAWPERWGGRDATLTQQLIHSQLMGEFDAPPPRNPIGLFNIGPMLLQWGTPDQQERWLPPMVRADEIWCQGFSEPGAGSDLAALSTRAEDRGDHWLVTGQKVWTSLADEAARCLALVRTTPDGPKHKGITALVIDMDAPGVEVRPLREITGDDGFNEIFFDEVVVPKDRVVGEVDNGWKVAMSTLTHERLGAMKLGIQLRNRLDQLVDLAQRTGSVDDPVLRQRLADLAIRVDLMQLLTQEAMTALQRGEDPGASLPLGKLQWGELMQELAELGLDMQGPYAQLDGDSRRAIEGDWQHHTLYSRMTTIGAGTTQVQKNIMAYRILGLPRDADADPRPGTIERPRPLPEEQATLRDTVRRFLDEQCPTSWVRMMLDDPRGTTDQVWKGITSLGLPGLLVPEQHGGLGLGHAEMALVLEEMGRALHPGPYQSTALGVVDAILLSEDEEAAARFLPRVADGSLVGSLALLEPGTGWHWRDAVATATRDDGAWRLDGTKLFVPDGAAADLLIVSARVDGGLGLFTVEVADQDGGLDVAALQTVDGTRKQAEVTLRGAQARRLGGEAAPGDEMIEGLVDRLTAGNVMDAVGAARRALELATEYAKVRVQFDRPIGSFQAVQHLLADILRRVELSRVAAVDALRAADGDDPARLHRAAAAAKAYASDALYRATADVIQVFGGIGFTWEHDAHLYYKRAMSMQHAFGGGARHRAEYADRMLGTVEGRGW